MKKALTIIVCIITFSGYLSAQRSVKLMIGTGMDFNVNFPEGTKYEPFAHGRVAMWNFEANLKIPIGRFSVYPSFIYSIPMRDMLIKNPDGDYIPLGFGFQETYVDGSGPGSSWVFTNDYETMTSEAEVWQMSMGSYFTVELTEGLEIGSGLFFREKKTWISDYSAYDEYFLSDGDGVWFGEYHWDQTYEYNQPSEVSLVKTRSLSVPLIAQYSYYTSGPFFGGGRFVYWLGNDPYFSLGGFTGISF